MNTVDISDIASEAGVIASIILKPELVFYSEQLTPHHFTNQQNGYMYYAVSELAKKDINEIDAYNITNILNSKAATRDRADSILSIPAINDFIENAPAIARASTEEYKMLAANVLNAAFRRNTYSKLEECKQLCVNCEEDDIEQQIYAALDDVMLEYSSTADMPQYKDIVDELWGEIKARQRGETTAIEFPFPALNEYVIMEPGEVICFTAGAKAGKSAILLSCTVDLLKKNKAVLYIDSEISTKLFTLRMISHLTKIKFSDLRAGNYSWEDEKKIEDAIAWLKTRRFIHIYLPVFDDKSMYLAAKKAKHMIDIDCIVVDYLKSTTSKDEAFSVYAELGRMSDTLKNRIAGDMKICGLTAAQATNTGKIADSAKIARSVSTVISISEKSPEEIESQGIECGTKKMRVVFNRNGAQQSENEWIDMNFNGSVVTYEQAPKQHEEEVPY